MLAKYTFTLKATARGQNPWPKAHLMYRERRRAAVLAVAVGVDELLQAAHLDAQPRLTGRRVAAVMKGTAV